MTNYTKILKLLKLEVQEVMDDQPELDRTEVLAEILEGIKTDMKNDSEEDEEIEKNEPRSINVPELVLGMGEVVLSGALIVTLLYLIFPFRF